MTKLIYEYDGRKWTLTDEAASCSYGEPVLIADDGTQMRAGEVAYIEPPLFDSPEFKGTPITAAMITCDRAHVVAQTVTTEEWGMVRRFLRQAGA